MLGHRGIPYSLQDKQTFFFTAVDPMTETREIPLYEVDEPRMVPYKTNGKRHEDAVLFSTPNFIALWGVNYALQFTIPPKMITDVSLKLIPKQ